MNTVATIDSSTIFNNTTDSNGGGIAQDADSSLTVTNSTIIGNGPTTDASINGGGVFLQGDSDAIDSFSSNTIGDSGSGDANTAAVGGGVYINGVDPTFSEDTISDNIVTGDGGGVYIVTGVNSFTDETISDNQATGSDSAGGGVFIDDGVNTFSDTSINENQAEDGAIRGRRLHQPRQQHLHRHGRQLQPSNRERRKWRTRRRVLLRRRDQHVHRWLDRLQ